jgi:hypothetical protein
MREITLEVVSPETLNLSKKNKKSAQKILGLNYKSYC